MRIRRAIRTLISVAAVLAVALPSSLEGAQRANHTQRAIQLLVDVAKEARGLNDVRLRVRVLAAAADLLWPHEARQARAVFDQAYADTETMPPPEGDASSYGPDDRLAIRGDILRIARRHDPRRVSELQKRIVAASPGQAALALDPKEWKFGSSARVLELAAFLAKVDPVASAEILLRLSDVDPSQPLFKDAVNDLRAADPSLAARVVAKIVERLADQPGRYSPLARSARLVFPARQELDAGIWASTPRESIASTTDPVLARLYLETLHGRAVFEIAAIEAELDKLTVTDAAKPSTQEAGELLEELGVMYETVTMLDREFEQFDPQRLADQRSLGARVERLVARVLTVRPVEELRTDVRVAYWLARQHGDLTERVRRMIALESKLEFDDDRMQAHQLEVSEFAERNGDFATAKSYAGKIGEPSFLTSANLIRVHAARAAARDGRLDEANREIGEIDDPARRSEACLVIGAEFAERGDRQRALEFLDRVAVPGPRSNGKASDFEARFIAIYAESLARVEPERGFLSLKDAIEVENRSDGRLTSIWPPQPGLAGAFEALAPVQLERALALAATLRNPTVSLVCRLCIARAVLTHR